MNYPIVCRSLALISLLIAVVMVFSLPWAFPALGHRRVDPTTLAQARFESDGFFALLASIVVCGVVGSGFWYYSRGRSGHMYRKEALAVVGLSWILATVLGALPFYFSGVYRCAGVRLLGPQQPVLVYRFGVVTWRQQWFAIDNVSPAQYDLLTVLADAGAHGLSWSELEAESGAAAKDLLDSLLASDPHWQDVLLLPGQEATSSSNSDTIRLRWVKMGICDALFESQSGFSTTGATVIADLENSELVPHCILFWRSSTHFLGGLGIIVLFVTILGQGSAGKALMRAEMPGPTKEGATARMQHTAWLIAATYLGLNAVLAVLLMLLGLSTFDALCHAFGTMATGGFSTYNASLGHFQSPLIEYLVVVFMVLAGTNFTLLFLSLRGHPQRLLGDIEWRAYIATILGVTIMVIGFGMMRGDFLGLGEAIRYSLFQVVSIITTTGFGTSNFDGWNSFGRGVLFLLMFVGGCAGSTGGGLKVIRHILFLKVMKLEIERAYHPTVVRPLRLGGKAVDDPNLRKNILVYFGLILVIFVFSWMFLVTVEPDITWGTGIENKLIDCASGIAATLNNIGPGLGTVGATENYTMFSPVSKILFVWLMMIGRLEIFAILVLFSPSFWRHC